MTMRRCALLLAALSLALLSTADAGDYRNGRTKPLRDVATLSWNYAPVPTLARHQLPEHFNWCDEDGLNSCTSSWNQHIPVYCGSCWAHGTLAAIQDRLKIRKGGLGKDVMLSRQALLNCGAFDGFGGGCNGGDPIDVFHYMQKHGLPDESCQLYNATDHTKWGTEKEIKGKECPAIGKCQNCMPINGSDTCWPVKTPILYKLKSYGKIRDGGELGIMSEVHKNGPITCSIATPDNFVYDFRGGPGRNGIAFDKDYNKTDVDHDIEVVGWGEEDGVKFWHIRNSWGTFWGELGFFRLERGKNALQIESGDCWLAEPDYEMEEDVRHGEYEGSMYGLVEEDNKVRAPRATDATRLVTATSTSHATGILRKMFMFAA